MPGHGQRGGDPPEGQPGFGGGWGVRRPLRFLAHKLNLDSKQVAEMARILDELKIERAQAEVDERRATAEFADAVEGALLVEEAAWALDRNGDARKAAVARRFAGRRLATPALRGITDPDRSVLDLFEPLVRYGSIEESDLAASINVPNNAAAGQYNIKINTQDTTGEPSHSFTVVLAVHQDFVVTSATPLQAVNPGQTTGAYQLTIQPVGTSFNAPVTLSCSGLPAGAQCLFSPSAPQTPGNSAVNVVMTISTASAKSSANLRLCNSPMSSGAPSR